MSEQLFVFVAVAVADEGSTYRSGARHALMLFATGPSIEVAQQKAVTGAETAGWSFVGVQRGKFIEGADSDDETLTAAAEHALENGSALIVYGKEIPADA